MAGRDDRGNAQYQADVGDVRADGVADGKQRIAIQCGCQGYQNFRRGCTQTDDGQTDDHFRDAGIRCGCRRPGKESISAPYQRDESDEQDEDGNPHGIRQGLVATGAANG